MKVTQQDAHIKLDFDYDKRIVDRLKARLPKATWDKAAKCWWMPCSEAYRLPDAFPRASYSYDAIGAICDAESALGERFYRQMRHFGISLHLAADGSVYASGDSVSQEIATEVHRRSDMLRPYVEAQREDVDHAEQLRLIGEE